MKKTQDNWEQIGGVGRLAANDPGPYVLQLGSTTSIVEPIVEAVCLRWSSFLRLPKLCGSSSL
jgi:hypothetical protein